MRNLKELPSNQGESRSLNDSACTATNTSFEESKSLNDSAFSAANTSVCSSTKEPSEGECIVELSLEPSISGFIPEGAGVIYSTGNDQTNDSNSTEPRPCPPAMALEALESSFTPRKKKKYNTMFEKGENGSTDPVYTTWHYLKKKVENPDAYIVNPTDRSNHPLVKLGVIAESIAEVFTCPADDAGHLTKMRKMPKARVLTSSDIASEIRKRDEKKKAADAGHEKCLKIKTSNLIAREAKAI